GCATPLGAQLAGLEGASGTMPHSMILLFGDTVKAALAFDKNMGDDVLRIVLVDTFKDEAEESLRVAEALGKRLRGVRLDTPGEARWGRPFGRRHLRLGRPGRRTDSPVRGGEVSDSLVRRRDGDQLRPADRLHGGYQGDRGQTHDQTGPHSRRCAEPPPGSRD